MSKSKREVKKSGGASNGPKTQSSSGTTTKVLKTGNMKLKGENFYHDKVKVQKKNMLKGGQPKRNKSGRIIQAAAFQSKDAPTARVQPDRRWFGNTRVVGQGQLEEFRNQLGQKQHDPYQILLNRSKLPMSLLTDHGKTSRMNLLSSESFDYTFGKGAQRKKPKLSVGGLEELVKKAQSQLEEEDKRVDVVEEYEDLVKDPLFSKGQSKRIWNELYKVIDSSDVVVHVLDARNPLGTRCKSVESFIAKEAPHKHLIFILNKCDLVPPRVTSKWVKYLSKSRPTLAFHASITNPFGMGTLMTLLRQYSKLHKDKKQISVGFIGYPNTGKSSIINTLCKKAVCTTAPVPGETKVWQYVTLMKRIYLIDCPGVVPAAVDDTEAETVLKGVLRVENLERPEDYIQELLSRVEKVHIQRTYGVWSWKDSEEFLSKVALKSGKLLKGGEPDLVCVAKSVLQDWLRGKIPYFTPPPAEVNGGEDGEVGGEAEAEAEAEGEEVEEEEEGEENGAQMVDNARKENTTRASNNTKQEIESAENQPETQNRQDSKI